MKEIIEQTEVGIESIEFSIADNLDHLNDSIGSYRERLKFMGCRGLTLHGPFMNIDPAAFDSEVRKITMMRFHQTYTAGMELGAKKIIYHTCMNPYVHYLQGWPERVAEFFGEFLEEHKELEVVMENVFDPQIDPVLDGYKLLGEKYPNFHLCFDMGHAHCYSKIPVLEWTEKLAPYVTHVHVHDNNGDRDSHAALGAGNIPYERVLGLLPETRERTWTIECCSKKDVLQSIRVLHNISRTRKENLQRSRELFDKKFPNC